MEGKLLSFPPQELSRTESRMVVSNVCVGSDGFNGIRTRGYNNLTGLFLLNAAQTLTRARLSGCGRKVFGTSR